jgi:hypothetical protein
VALLRWCLGVLRQPCPDDLAVGVHDRAWPWPPEVVVSRYREKFACLTTHLRWHVMSS